MGKLILSGRDADLTARTLFTRDVTEDINRSYYTLILNKHGGIESDLVVTKKRNENGQGNVVCHEQFNTFISVVPHMAWENYTEHLGIKIFMYSNKCKDLHNISYFYYTISVL